ncbi:MAG: DUF202 domain-containing protein [Parachlamydia sp.]|nr:DUF202 domain-containing protein [Parachlamydia sp.]
MSEHNGDQDEDKEFTEKTQAELRTEMAEERTRLAAERTLSAWIRTGLAGVGGGLGIIHFLVFENVYHRMLAKIFGQFLILWGGMLFFYGFYDYHRLVKELSPAISTSKIAIIAFMTLSLAFLSIAFFIFSFKF